MESKETTSTITTAELIELDSEDSSESSRICKICSKNSHRFVQGFRSSSTYSSVQCDDRSAHLSRLLEETEHSLSHKDLLIAMLQQQLKKIEDLYKKSLDESQNVRCRYCSTAQELNHLKKICKKNEQNSDSLVKQTSEYAKCKSEISRLQNEIEQWKKQYEQLQETVQERKNNFITNNAQTEPDINESNLQKLTEQEEIMKNNISLLKEHHSNIEKTLLVQNSKLESIIESLERTREENKCNIIPTELSEITTEAQKLRLLTETMLNSSLENLRQQNQVLREKINTMTYEQSKAVMFHIYKKNNTEENQSFYDKNNDQIKFNSDNFQLRKDTTSESVLDSDDNIIVYKKLPQELESDCHSLRKKSEPTDTNNMRRSVSFSLNHEKLNLEIIQVHKENLELQDTIQQLKDLNYEKMTEMDLEITQLKKKLKNDGNTKELEAELIKKNDVINEHKRAHNMLKNDYENMIMMTNTLKIELTDKEAQINNNEEKMKKLLNEVEVLKGQLDHINTQQSVHIADINTLNADSTQKAELIDGYECKINDLNMENKEAAALLEKFRRENGTLISKLEIAQKTMQQYKEEAEFRKLENTNLRNKAEELQNEFDEMKKSTKQFKEQFDQQIEQLEKNSTTEKQDEKFPPQENAIEFHNLQSKNDHLQIEIEEKNKQIHELMSKLDEVQNEMDFVKQNQAKQQNTFDKEYDEIKCLYLNLESDIENTRINYDTQILSQKLKIMDVMKENDLLKIKFGLDQDLVTNIQSGYKLSGQPIENTNSIANASNNSIYYVPVRQEENMNLITIESNQIEKDKSKLLQDNASYNNDLPEQQTVNTTNMNDKNDILGSLKQELDEILMKLSIREEGNFLNEGDSLETILQILIHRLKKKLEEIVNQHSMPITNNELLPLAVNEFESTETQFEGTNDVTCSSSVASYSTEEQAKIGGFDQMSESKEETSNSNVYATDKLNIPTQINIYKGQNTTSIKYCSPIPMQLSSMSPEAIRIQCPNLSNSSEQNTADTNELKFKENYLLHRIGSINVKLNLLNRKYKQDFDVHETQSQSLPNLAECLLVPQENENARCSAKCQTKYVFKPNPSFRTRTKILYKNDKMQDHDSNITDVVNINRSPSVDSIPNLENSKCCMEIGSGIQQGHHFIQCKHCYALGFLQAEKQLRKTCAAINNFKKEIHDAKGNSPEYSLHKPSKCSKRSGTSSSYFGCNCLSERVQNLKDQLKTTSRINKEITELCKGVDKKQSHVRKCEEVKCPKRKEKYQIEDELQQHFLNSRAQLLKELNSVQAALKENNEDQIHQNTSAQVTQKEGNDHKLSKGNWNNYSCKSRKIQGT